MENGVRNSKLFLAFISPQYAASANYQRELKLKLGNDLKKKIICCLVDPASRFENKGWPPPGIGTLVAGGLYIDLTKHYEQNFEQLLSQIQIFLGIESLIPAPAPISTPKATKIPIRDPAASSTSVAATDSGKIDLSDLMHFLQQHFTDINERIDNLSSRLDQVVTLLERNK